VPHTSPKKQHSELWSFLLPPSYLTLVLLIDYVIPSTTITPLFLAIGMMVMAYMMRPVRMISWSAIYVLVTCSIFLSPNLYKFFSGRIFPVDWIGLYFRSLVYIIFWFLTIFLNLAFNRLKRVEVEFNSILLNIPYPVITSDINGKILYFNQVASEIFYSGEPLPVVESYFDLFSPKDEKGKTIASYLKCFENNEAQLLNLTMKGCSVLAQVRVITAFNQPILLTTLVQPLKEDS
jgi:PAS domain-containing protein